MKPSFRLDKTNGWFGGVCAGISEMLEIHPDFVRIGVVLAALFFTKLTIAAYVITYLVFNDRVSKRY